MNLVRAYYCREPREPREPTNFTYHSFYRPVVVVYYCTKMLFELFVCLLVSSASANKLACQARGVKRSIHDDDDQSETNLNLHSSTTLNCGQKTLLAAGGACRDGCAHACQAHVLSLRTVLLLYLAFKLLHAQERDRPFLDMQNAERTKKVRTQLHRESLPIHKRDHTHLLLLTSKPRASVFSRFFLLFSLSLFKYFEE